jgi:hypothetical protein
MTDKNVGEEGVVDVLQVRAQTLSWLEQAVIGLNLCPFATSVYVNSQVRVVVSTAKHLDAFLDELDVELLLLRVSGFFGFQRFSKYRGRCGGRA